MGMDERTGAPPSFLPPRSRPAFPAVPFATGALAFAAYAATAARTITWWDGSSYPLAAVTLGIPGAPGSLILTLLGWVVSRIPLIDPVAFRLNLFAALLAASLAGLVAWLGMRLATPEGREPGWSEWFAGALAGLTFAFALTPWTYAVQFTPYGLSALWTALILIAALAWWRRPEASRGRARLFLLFLLFGLDLSVHRTNSLLLPATLLWIALRRPASDSRLRDGLAGAAGLVLGLAFHLLLIPLAARQPSYMVEGPTDLAAWWSYVTIQQKGGGFLVKLFPRTADFVSVQLADYLAFLRRNLSTTWYLPLGLAALGWLVTVRHHPRRALGMLAFLLCAGLGAVLYFNLPRNYIRPIDRHYLPSLVVLAPWIAVGAAAVLRRAARMPVGPVLASCLVVVLALTPLAAWRANREACDLSRTAFAEGFARDLLEPLPEHAILLTNGDNDSIPLWYMQQVEGVRPDVMVINLPVANTGSCLARLRRSDPDLAGLLAREPERGVLPVLTVKDSTVATRVEPRAGLGLPAGAAVPDSVVFRPSGELMGSDRVVLDLVRLNRWRRPIHLACTVVRDQVPWLWPYARLDGLAFRVIPSDDPAVWDVDHLRGQLFERVRYRGIADGKVRMDIDSRAMCRNYGFALFQLAAAQLARGQARPALATMQFMEDHVPLGRLGVAAEEIAGLRAQIEEAVRVSPAD
jgi:transmembrane protein TMEM260 (protein O-mannosyltransferase)